MKRVFFVLSYRLDHSRSVGNVWIDADDSIRCDVCEINHVVIRDECVEDGRTRRLQSAKKQSLPVEDLLSVRSQGEPVPTAVVNRDMITSRRAHCRRCIEKKLLCPMRDVSRIGIRVHAIVLPRCQVEKGVVTTEETMWILIADSLVTDDIVLFWRGTGSIEIH